MIKNMKKVKNKCPECGGCLLIEAIGNYGDVYRMKANGEMSKKRIKRCIYETSGDYMIYCENCGNTVDPREYGY